ncbi:reverse transcriptase domain-containing protein [Tanacetum coccineum]|uniref:Reverse transcriptase domain-containing protein n=1 Tax=Tanacetum coccineum TaxID=301880 RepID=A0ABQ5ISJ5_9ASTR
MTATLKFRDVPNDVIKLMLFPYLLEGAARIWCELRLLGEKFLVRRRMYKTDDRIDKLADQISNLVEIRLNRKVLSRPPNTVKGRFFLRKPSLTSCALPSNAIPNRRVDDEESSTRSDVAYEGPSILYLPFSKRDSTAHINLSVIPISILNRCSDDLPSLIFHFLLRLNDPKARKKVYESNGRSSFKSFKIYTSNLAFTDVLLLMPKFASTIKSLLTNKDKLFELAKIPLNENCSAMLLKKLLEKLRDPGKFLIPCDVPRMDKLFPYVPHRMTLELADRSITRPKGVAKDFFVKVGKFHFLTDFVVVDFDADPRVPLILKRSFLRIGRALIDVYREEITLRVNDKAPIISTLSLFPSLKTVEGEKYSDFILERSRLLFKDDSISPKIDHANFDLEGDLCLLEKLLNDDPSSPLPPKELNFEKLNDFSSINVFKERSVTFSNLLFDSNDDFTSSDDESLSDEVVLDDNVKIYSNPLFEYDDEYISIDINPLFDEVLEDIKSKDSYVSNLDEPALLVTPLFDSNEDECFDPGDVIDEIDAFLDMDISTDIENGYHDSEGDIIYLESLLIDDTIPNLHPEVFLDHDTRSLKDEPDNDDLMTEDKVFNLGIWEIIFSPTYGSLPFEDHHYFSFTYVIRTFLPYFTYLVNSPFPLSYGSEEYHF